MNLLFVCHRVPYPPSSGGKIRAYHMIRHFAEAGYKVTVATLAFDEKEKQDAQPLGEMVEALNIEVVPTWLRLWRSVRSLFSQRSASEAYFSASKSFIKNILAKQSYDLAVVHCSSVAPWVSALADCPKVLDYCDIDSEKWRDYAKISGFPKRHIYALEARKVAQLEARVASHFELLTCTSQQELIDMRKFAPDDRCESYANGVDTDFFSVSNKPYDPFQIGFLGRMDYLPNVQAVVFFAQRILPALRAELGDIQFRIIGSAPTAEVVELASKPYIEVTGFVDDVRPLAQACLATVCPLTIARGTQNKILESMAMAVPVVSSELASGGVDARPGLDLLVADSDEVWISHLLALHQQPDYRQLLAAAGRDCVIRNHQWPTNLARMSKRIESIQSNWVSRG